MSNFCNNVPTVIGRKLEIKMVALSYSGKLIIPNLMRIFHFVQKSLRVAWNYITQEDDDTTRLFHLK
jgi:hypothetical protein